MKESKSKTIEDVSDYLKEVKEIVRRRDERKYEYKFRGEPKEYPKPCMPGLFRKNYLTNNKYYEISILNAMRQNKLSNQNSYLENAMDAQHGEFPSRLLDVSDNCLSALYFAVTPYYHFDEDKYDKEDGAVYVFFIDDIMSPSAENTVATYDSIIKHDKEWFENNRLFSMNHKYIGQAKINKRIIAQQGAFILFQGDSMLELPDYMYEKIKIPAKAKKQLRQDLNMYFGIHTGSIYPEITNLVSDLDRESNYVKNDKFEEKSELDYVLKTLDRELDYYGGILIERNRKNENISAALAYVEKIIARYRIGIIEYDDYISRFCYDDDISREKKENLEKICNDYNELLKKYGCFLEEFGIENIFRKLYL